MQPNVIVVTGPTATGKTALGAELSLRFGGEVVSADSVQIYNFMDIGTAKPTEEEKRGVPHHMIDVASPFEDYSAARYVEEASACIDGILSRHKTPVIVGGTGLYIESLISGRSFAAKSDGALRQELADMYDELGGDEMLRLLSSFDAAAAAKLFANDKRRIVRAFEIYRLTGITATEHDLRSRDIPPRYRACVIALSFEQRQDLYDRINTRVDKMLENGLYDEVKSLLAMGLSPRCTAMQAIGYKELAAAISGDVPLQQAVEKVKLESRRYAKRQLSWLRRNEAIHWILWRKKPDLAEGALASTKYLTMCGYNIAV